MLHVADVFLRTNTTTVLSVELYAWRQKHTAFRSFSRSSHFFDKWQFSVTMSLQFKKGLTPFYPPPKTENATRNDFNRHFI